MNKPTDDEPRPDEGAAQEVDEDTLPPLSEEQRAAAAKHFREQGKWYNR